MSAEYFLILNQKSIYSLRASFPNNEFKSYYLSSKGVTFSVCLAEVLGEDLMEDLVD